VKFPKTHKCFSYIKEVWRETFPDEAGRSRSKIQQRKEAAKQQREYEMSADDIEKL